MNYMKIYHDICNRGHERGVKKMKYFELHHIIPASYFKSRNKATYNENLCLLTPKEHYIVHHLLARTGCPKMTSAFWFMATKKKISSSKEFEKIKQNLKPSKDSIAKMIKTKKDNGFKHSEETKEKMRLNNIGERNPNFGNTSNKSKLFGRKASKETKIKMRQYFLTHTHANKGKHWFHDIKTKTNYLLFEHEITNEHVKGRYRFVPTVLR